MVELAVVEEGGRGDTKKPVQHVRKRQQAKGLVFDED